MTEEAPRKGFLKTDEAALADALKKVCTPHAAPEDAVMVTRAATGGEIGGGDLPLAVVHLFIPRGTPLWRVLDAIDLACQRAKNEARWHAIYGAGRHTVPDSED